MASYQRIQVIDSHTGGEPTRVVVAGGPMLSGSITEKFAAFATGHDRFRSAVVNEPRGSDVLVGALLCEPVDPANCCGVIFFNNVGVLGMCGHGTIGVVTTLAHLGRIGPGTHGIETCAGVVSATLHEDGTVSLRNVRSWRRAQAVTVEVPGYGPVTGDVAWGGNWFFLISGNGRAIRLSEVEALTEYTWRVRQAVNTQGFPEVDHVEVFGPPGDPASHSRNFVLCPGKAYDRSPCGTGTSAKLACLYADGKIRPGELWLQESIVGSVFTGSVEPAEEEGVIPTITGQAWITGENTLLLDAADPFIHGIRHP